MGEFVQKSFKWNLTFPQPSGSLDVSPSGFQDETLWRLIFLLQVPQVGEFDIRLGPLIPQGGTPWLWYLFSLWITATGVWVLTSPCLCPSYFILMWPSLYILSFKNLLLLFRSFLEITILYVNSCSFGAFVGKLKFRIFLLHHLDLDPVFPLGLL